MANETQGRDPAAPRVEPHHNAVQPGGPEVGEKDTARTTGFEDRVKGLLGKVPDVGSRPATDAEYRELLAAIYREGRHVVWSLNSAAASREIDDIIQSAALKVVALHYAGRLSIRESVTGLARRIVWTTALDFLRRWSNGVGGLSVTLSDNDSVHGEMLHDAEASAELVLEQRETTAMRTDILAEIVEMDTPEGRLLAADIADLAAEVGRTNATKAAAVGVSVRSSYNLRRRLCSTARVILAVRSEGPTDDGSTPRRGRQKRE